MYIACPNCNIKFLVPNEQIGFPGRKVKCSKCAYIWFQKLDPSTKLTDFITNTEELAAPPAIPAETEKVTIPWKSPNLHNELQFTKGINVPALLPAKIYKKFEILSLLWFSLITLLLLMLFHDSFAIKSWKQNELIIDKVTAKINKNSQEVKIVYNVTNISNNIILLPLIRVRLLNNKRVLIKSYIINQLNITLAPHKNIYITMNLPVAVALVEHLDITLGNRLDFILNNL